LDRDETLLWTGQPKPGILFRNTDFFVIPFSLFWLAFALFWTYLALGTGDFFGEKGLPILAWFGVPFIMVGIVLAFARFPLDARFREKTVYGLTEHRILVKSGLFSEVFQSYELNELGPLRMREGKNGFGTIALIGGDESMLTSSGLDWWPGSKPVAHLDMIPNVQTVYQQILYLQKEQ
ncbi:MAG: hypothetical protein AAGH79_15450, partial [Bacteroidota bacterium]